MGRLWFQRGGKRVICSCTTKFQAYIVYQTWKAGREKREKKLERFGVVPSGKRGGFVRISDMICDLAPFATTKGTQKIKDCPVSFSMFVVVI